MKRLFLLAIFLTGLSFFIAGWHFGINQDAYYLPLITNQGNDTYSRALQGYVTWFYPVLAFFGRWFRLAIVFAASQLVTSFIFILSLLLLSKTFFTTSLPGILATLFLITPKFALGGILVGINHTYLYQTQTAFSVSLLALWLFFEGRLFLAFLLAGIIVYIQSLTGLQLLALFIFASLFKAKSKQLFLVLSFVALMITPIAVKQLGVTANVNLADWLLVNRLRNGHHLFPDQWDLLTWGKGLWPILPVIWLIKLKVIKEQAMIIRLGMGVLLLWLIGLVFTTLYPIKAIIQLQLFRSSQWLVVVGWLCLSSWFTLKPIRWLLGLTLLVWVLKGVIAVWPNQFQISSFDQNWLAAQNWIKDNTSPDARLYLLPYLPTFRAFSNRSHNLTWPEMTTAIVVDEVVKEALVMLKTFNLDPVSLETKKASVSDISQLLLTQTKELKPDYLTNLAVNSGAQYLVLPKGFIFSQKAVYANPDFSVLYLTQ